MMRRGIQSVCCGVAILCILVSARANQVLPVLLVPSDADMDQVEGWRRWLWAETQFAIYWYSISIGEDDTAETPSCVVAHSDQPTSYFQDGGTFFDRCKNEVNDAGYWPSSTRRLNIACLGGGSFSYGRSDGYAINSTVNSGASVMAHELGHAFGMTHVWNVDRPYDVMYDVWNWPFLPANPASSGNYRGLRGRDNNTGQWHDDWLRANRRDWFRGEPSAFQIFSPGSGWAFGGNDSTESGDWDNSASATWNRPAAGTANQTWAGGRAVFWKAQQPRLVEDVSAINLTFVNVINLSKSGDPTITLTGSGPNVMVHSDSRVWCNIGGSQGLFKGGRGALTMTGRGVYTGETTVAAGTFKIDNSNVIPDDSTVFIAKRGTLYLRGDRTETVGAVQGHGSVQLNSPGPFTTGANNTDAHFYDRIEGGAAIVKTGTGLWGLHGDNTFSGVFTINGGMVRTYHANALGSESTGTIVTSEGTLDLYGQDLGNEVVTVDGAGVGGNGAIVNSSSDELNALNRVILAGTATFGGSGRWDIGRAGGGYLNGNGHALTKVGGNTVALLNVGETDLGDIDIREGTLGIETDVRLGRTNHTLRVQNGATLRFWNSSVHHTKPMQLDGGTVLVGSGMVDLSGAVEMLSPSAFETASGTSIALHGDLSGAGAWYKRGLGDATVSGTNNTGTGLIRVEEGTLTVNGNVGPGASMLQAMNGGTLLGNGQVDRLTRIDTGAVFVPSIGSFATKALQFGTGGACTLRIEGYEFQPPRIVVTARNGLTVDGSVTVEIGSFLLPGRYPLIESAGAIGGDGFGAFTLGALPSDVLSAHLEDNTAETSIDLVVDRVEALTWTGMTDDQWDLAGAVNWRDSGGGEAAYGDGRRVLFDDSATGGTVVDVITNVHPSEVLVAANTNHYTLNPSGGGIAGTARLVKSGAGELTLLSGHSYSGGTVVVNGTLAFDTDYGLPAGPGRPNTRVLGSGVLDINGHRTPVNGLEGDGTIDNTAAQDNWLQFGHDTLDAVFDGTVRNTGSGSLRFMKSGDGSQTFTGPIDIKGNLWHRGGGVHFADGCVARLGGWGNIGASGAGTVRLYIARGSDVTFDGIILGNGSTGYLYVSGRLTLSKLSGGASTSRCWIDGGTLVPSMSRDDFLFGLTSCEILTGGVTINTDGQDIAVTQLIGGDGGLTKTGAGRLMLNGSNTFAGVTSVDEGVLGGNGILAGPVQIDMDGMLAPGTNGIGTLTVSNTVNTSGVIEMDIAKSGVTRSADRLVVVRLEAGATLRVLHHGDPLAVGDTFDLIDAGSFVGTFGTFDLPPLRADQGWDTSRLMVDGTISVIAVTVAPYTWHTDSDGLWSDTSSNGWNTGGADVPDGQADVVYLDKLDLATNRTLTIDVIGARAAQLRMEDLGSGTQHGWTVVAGGLGRTLAIDGVSGTRPDFVVRGAATHTVSAPVQLAPGSYMEGYTHIDTDATLVFTGGITWKDGAGPLFGDSTTGWLKPRQDGLMVLRGGYHEIYGFSWRDGVHNCVLDGGELHVFRYYIGGDTGAGRMEIKNGGALTVHGTGFHVGGGAFNGDHRLVLMDGEITSTPPLLIANSGNGWVHLNGGTLTVPNIMRGASAGTANLQLNGGTLRPGGNRADFIATGITVRVQSGGAVVDTAGFDVSINALLLNDGGGLTKTGLGTLALNAAGNTYTGSTTVAMGTLAGVGRIAGPVIVETTGTLAPGNSDLGTLTVSNLSLSGSVIMEIDGDTLTSDRLLGISSLTYGGTLNVVLAAGTLEAGDSFDLFDASVFSGTFDRFDLPALPPTLGWDISRLSTDGSLRVIAHRFEAGISVDSAKLILQWSSLSGEQYSVWRSPDLLTGNWQHVMGGIGATPPVNIFTNIGHGAFREYYRVGRQ